MQAPVDIVYHQKTKELEIVDVDGCSYRYSAEYLRVMSPSAAVQGHTPDEAKLQVGKRNVSIVGLEPVGLYALRIVFSDGHDSGYYDWDYLRMLGREKEARWQGYLQALEMHNASRDPDDPRNEPFKDKPKRACHGHS